jgi:lysophospholipase L1-like esterase
MTLRMTLVVLALAGTTWQAPPSGAGAGSPPPAGCPEVALAINAVMSNDARLKDWAQLARYRDANRRAAADAPSAARVVFMGDSITDFWQQPRFGPLFQGTPYIDRGISGQTTPQMLVRFRADVIALKPKVVVILAGTNDIAGNTGPMTDEQIEGNLESMSELAHAHQIAVVLSSVTPVSGYHHRADDVRAPQTTLRPLARIRALNEWMKAYAAAHHDVYLDYFSPMLDDAGVLREELSNDDLHPNDKGYAIMAPLAEAAIQRALK